MKKMKAEQMLGLLLLILGLQGKTHGESQTFNDGEKLQLPESYSIGWMSNLIDNLLISEITLPGTHDSMARYGGPAIDRQAWTLEDQLKAGIRYLELKAFAFENTLYLMHGIIYEFSTFTETLETIKTFLSSYPSETILIRVKPDLFDKSKVQELLEKITTNDVNIWVQSNMPTLGEVRGKVVVVQDNSINLGISLIKTEPKKDNEVVNIQRKEDEITNSLNQVNCGVASVAVTYSSGTGIGTFEGMFLTPKRVAEKVNPWLYNDLQPLISVGLPNCFGIIAMDFPGFDLIQTIIQSNYFEIFQRKMN